VTLARLLEVVSVVLWPPQTLMISTRTLRESFVLQCLVWIREERSTTSSTSAPITCPSPTLIFNPSSRWMSALAKVYRKACNWRLRSPQKKQERNARHAAQTIEQGARSKIEGQKIQNQTEAEEAKQTLIQLQAESAAVASTGTAKAEAEAKAEYYEIESTSDVEQAFLSAQASTIEAKAGLEEEKATQDAQLFYENATARMDLSKAERLASIETEKFKALVDAISPETIKAIARAGPEMQAKLLKGLGLKGYLMTDGNSPINLFNAAKGMVGGGGMGGMSM